MLPLNVSNKETFLLYKSSGNNVEAGGSDTSEPKLTGLGPLKDANHLKVKQKIRLKDICGDICGCEVRKTMLTYNHFKWNAF